MRFERAQPPGLEKNAPMESPVATKKKERPPHVGDNIVEFDVIKEQAQARAPRPA